MREPITNGETVCKKISNELVEEADPNSFEVTQRELIKQLTQNRNSIIYNHQTNTPIEEKFIQNILTKQKRQKINSCPILVKNF